MINEVVRYQVTCWRSGTTFLRHQCQRLFRKFTSVSTGVCGRGKRTFEHFISHHIHSIPLQWS